MQLAMRKSETKKQQYSVSLIAAISQEQVVASQIIEGGVDSTIFENFVYQTLRSIRTDPRNSSRAVVLLMDNAVIHRHSSVLQTCRKMKVNVLFNAEYSPWLNPIEQLFGLVKKSLKNADVSTKYVLRLFNICRVQLVKEVQAVLKNLQEDEVKSLWAFSVKRWIQTIKFGHV
jgi:transposase